MYDGWSRVVEDPQDLQYADTQTIVALTRYSYGGVSFKHVNSKGFKDLFTSPDEKHVKKLVFKGIESAKYAGLYESFVKEVKDGLTLRTFSALKDTKTLAIFYHALEHVPYWFDVGFRQLYGGGSAISNRPRVETSLTKIFGKRGYYAIVYFVTLYWRELGAAVHHRPHEIKEDGTMLMQYYQQFHEQHWWELAYTCCVLWEGEPETFDLAKAMGEVRTFHVLMPLMHIMPSNLSPGNRQG